MDETIHPTPDAALDDSRDAPQDDARDETSHHPQDDAHRRIREGEIYYVRDDAAPEGWSTVEISGTADGSLAGFALGQLEAIPLTELEGRILGAVPAPQSALARVA